MSQTKAGAAKAKQTMIDKYGENYWVELGKLGGAKGAKDGVIKGFGAMDKDRLKEISRKGGSVTKAQR